MGIFGIVTKSEHEKLQQELAAMKADYSKIPDWLLATARAEEYTVPDPSKYETQADLYRVLSWVLQAVEISSASAAMARFDVKRVVANQEPRDIPNHPFELLLQHPNELDSRYEFLFATFAMFKLNGNAYWYLNGEDENAPPDELWFIPPHMIEPVPDRQSYIRGFLYHPGDGQEIFLEPWQICHFKRYNPFSRFVGLSALESLAVVSAGDLGQQKWNANFYGPNNARLPSVMTFEQMIEQGTWDKIKADTREAAKNREMLMLRGVGPGGVNWIQNSINQKDMEFLAARAFTKQEIQNTLAPGLSTWLSESSTLANSESNRAAFSELTVHPMHVIVGEKVTNSILKKYGGRQLVGMFEDVRMNDKAMRLREQEAFERTHTLEEVRREFYGDDPIGDERDRLLPAEIRATMTRAVIPNPPPEMVEPDTVSQLPAMMKADIDRWRRKALKARRWVGFESEHIPAIIHRQISGRLQGAETTEQIKAAFELPGIPAVKSSGDSADILRGLELAVKALERT
jgi:HK97 family phage portal protein